MCGRKTLKNAAATSEKNVCLTGAWAKKKKKKKTKKKKKKIKKWVQPQRTHALMTFFIASCDCLLFPAPKSSARVLQPLRQNGAAP
jgi:hypothetical protein